MSLICSGTVTSVDGDTGAGDRGTHSCPSSPTETECSSGFSTLRRRSVNVTEKVRQNKDGSKIQVVRESAVATSSRTDFRHCRHCMAEDGKDGLLVQRPLGTCSSHTYSVGRCLIPPPALLPR